MKNLKLDYGQPLAIVALLLVLSTAFAFVEEPVTPPPQPPRQSSPDLFSRMLEQMNQGLAFWMGEK
ncbi:hypothetical protein [Prosthecobacter dejongeii]|uniref:Uncharacterized protein n=1 Tax=Prosthecobacter dejongeii TaxID=48465 RepID=A0A7W7YM00_9BACT|nr:hypothetical protein [Prosthecobacter dejongeii]MBB5038519.1 hypothetical protein [Prosthecobacter dejongeii]